LHRREAFASTDRRLLRRLVIRGEAVIPYQQTDHAAVAA